MSNIIRRRDILAAAALLAAGAQRAAGQTAVRLRVSHTDPGLFGPVHERIRQRLAAVDPAIQISFEGVVRDYEEQARALLRLGMIGEQPDVDGKPYALPFAISVPVIFYNAALVRRAGGDPDRFPTTWPAIDDLARRITALGQPISGGFFAYETTGNWSFIALVESLGGHMMRDEDRTIAFDGPEGMQALEILRDFGAAAGMVAMTRDQARQAFGAGTLGILVDSSSALPGMRRSASDRLEIRAAPLPIPHPQGRLPAGGAAAMILARDATRQAAAWRYIRFAAGPIGQALLVPGTGYLTANAIALRDPALLGQYYEQNPLERVALGEIAGLLAAVPA